MKLVAQVLVVLGTLTALGCSGQLDRSDFTEVTCGAPRFILAGIRPAEAGTYVAAVGFGGSDPFGTFGTACSTAPDRPSCEKAIAEAVPTSSWDTREQGGAESLPRRGYFVVERDGVVTTAGTVDAVKAVLGSIDTPSEAVLIASLAHREASVDCGENHVVKTNGGFDVLLSLQRSCNNGKTEVRVHVSAAGETSVVDEYRKESSASCS